MSDDAPMRDWLVEGTAMVRRVYRVKARSAAEAEEAVENGADYTHEEDINEDIDSVILAPSE